MLYVACAAAVLSLASCKNKKAAPAAEETSAVPAYEVVENPQVDLAGFPVDDEGYIVIFDGTSLNGWRGYGKDNVPARWTIEDGCLKFTGTGAGESQSGDGGDIIFTKKFKNFELKFDWKISKGGNSGVFYLAREFAASLIKRQYREGYTLPEMPE